MIELTNIRKAFNQGRDNEFWALDGIDLTSKRNRSRPCAARAARARPRC